MGQKLYALTSQSSENTGRKYHAYIIELLANNWAVQGTHPDLAFELIGLSSTNSKILPLG